MYNIVSSAPVSTQAFSSLLRLSHRKSNNVSRHLPHVCMRLGSFADAATYHLSCRLSVGYQPVPFQFTVGYLSVLCWLPVGSGSAHYRLPVGLQPVARQFRVSSQSVIRRFTIRPPSSLCWSPEGSMSLQCRFPGDTIPICWSSYMPCPSPGAMPCGCRDVSMSRGHGSQAPG